MSKKTPIMDPASLPKHVAIIMDGNGRWAKAKHMPRIEGHRRGVENVREIVRFAGDIGLEYLTLFAFSAENWRRPEGEVHALMDLLETFLKRYTKELIQNGVRLRMIGQREGLPANALRELDRSMEATAHLEGHELILALNYGGRQEVIKACRELCMEAKAGNLDPDTLDWDLFAKHLYTTDIPDPDLLIRTSGEKRISNFLLMQCAYSELYFSDLYWPEFNRKALTEALNVYATRERRFGLTGEQLSKKS